jgi:hypothetical protein
MKGAGQVQTIMIALIMILFILAPLVGFLGALNSEYGLDDSSMNGTVAAADEFYNYTYQLKTNGTDGLEENPENFMITGLTGVTTVIFGSVNFIQNLITELVVMTGFNFEWMILPIMLIVTIVFIFAVANWLRGGGSQL